MTSTLKPIKNQEACGKGVFLALLHLLEAKGWKAQVVEAGTSGDVMGEKDQVAGSSAVGFHASTTENYSVPERKFMLELARRSLSSVVTNNGELPEVSLKELAPKLAEKRACFVTLTKDGELRGCIGHILPQEALHKAVTANARNAALRDPRFPAVQADEVERIKIEISVLTEPQPLSFSSPDELLKKLQPNQDGVVLRIGYRTATFLPQVWAEVPGKEEFLGRLSEKAGCEPLAWRGKDAAVSIYRAESFEEN